MKVKDILQTKVDFLLPNATLLEASKLIFGHKHKGLPIINNLKSQKLIGFITEQDILSLVFPSVKDFLEDYVHERDFEEMEKNTKSILTKKVKNVMNKKPISIHLDEAVLKAESIMKLKEISKLPVVDDKGKLIGIITKGDIFKSLISPKLRGFK